VCRDWKEKTVALGADGANVMLGERNGVYGSLKVSWYPKIDNFFEKYDFFIFS